MPKLDGITLLKQLRDDVWGKTAKVIILTSLSDDKRLQEAKNLGAEDYIIKTDRKIEEVYEEVISKLN
jgi:CheY-like chemotaxis protein